MATLGIDIPHDRLVDFCRKWKIIEMSLFGSVVRDDFGPESDVDVLVQFADDARVSSFDLVDLSDELTAVFGRPVDILTRRSVEACGNPWKVSAILDHAQQVYAA